MDRFVDKTVDVLTRFGEHLERRFSNDQSDNTYIRSSSSNILYPGDNSAFQRPFDDNDRKSDIYSSQRRNLSYGGARKYSSDNLVASPGYESFSNYRQNPMANTHMDDVDRALYGHRIDGRRKQRHNLNYGAYPEVYTTDPSSNSPYGLHSGNVGYAPNYYIAERREVELIPAPEPRIIRQQVPVPFPVDRPVPQPYPVAVPVPYPVDRPVPVPVAVPSPPVCVPVPTPTPCYVPVAVPVPSPRASPVIFEQSVTHSQRWITGSPVMMNQQRYAVGTPVMMNQQRYAVGTPVMMNQQPSAVGTPVMMNGQPYFPGSPAVGMNGYASYGNGSFRR
ncbi:unnamed protein product [Rotaria socialis]|uniref:Uncharacterized protein n=1 Tax=Rotaria socialis TaxID=392032 RepID=A0A820TX53_9BILA|nr:unnamed protein product [Rotaria socialis]CAF3400951.1 unnamed protein product [Rotaria socialis]CAF3424373.1 unnamed protein product [Rotaria socialis]CAF3604777.1 unnamed protein product [Rotaria socialis]CAF4373125.1 unnamed protein product [Rotaria socialis]